MDDVFRALADPSRRRLLDSLAEHDGQSLGELCGVLSMARQSVSKHLAVLEAANLVTTMRDGRRTLHHLSAHPTAAVEHWIARYSSPDVDASFGLIPRNVEEFVYPTYIRTTPERLWHAITNPAYSEQCMGHAIESDWLKGSTYVWLEDGHRIEDPEQVVLESDPYQRLAFTFRTLDATAEEPRSHVVFDIEPYDDQVKLTVTHESAGSVHSVISQMWPLKLSRLKTELESVP